eukprot:TRINITY_DN1149_c0_g1_i2.p2 TRINITY_DN1149_c0_g1~~TRINITY_DN1149_c0_g1_i2.p2  ORF type:complete len:177 (+),score=31.62 TRINITY_DN1149_c0_g1_i2:103-633(+)
MASSNHFGEWNVRPWSSFFETKSFHLPSNLQDWSARSRSNIEYYKANYALILLGILAFSLYLDITFIFPILLTVGGGFFVINKQDLQIQGRRLNFNEKLVIVGLAGIISMWITSTLDSFYYVVGISSLVILVHVSLRKSSMKAKVNNVMSDLNKEASSVERNINKKMDKLSEKLKN